MVNVILLIAWFRFWWPINDFRLFYAAADIGRRYGWPYIYNTSLESAELERVTGAVPPHWYFNNPPTLAWLVYPMTALPYPAAYGIAVAADVFLLAAAAALWRGRSTLAKKITFLTVAGFLPAAFAIAFVQLSPLVFAGLGVTRSLARNANKPSSVACGVIVGCLLALKPQLVVLLPLALLAGGYTTAALASMTTAGLLAAISIVVLGAHGTATYLATLRAVSSVDLGWSVAGLLGEPAWYLTVAITVTGTVIAARMRKSEPGRVLAIGVASSVLVNHHLTQADLTVLLVPVLVLAEERAPLAAIAWVLAWAALAIGALVLLAACALLIGTAVRPPVSATTAGFSRNNALGRGLGPALGRLARPPGNRSPLAD